MREVQRTDYIIEFSVRHGDQGEVISYIGEAFLESEFNKFLIQGEDHRRRSYEGKGHDGKAYSQILPIPQPGTIKPRGHTFTIRFSDTSEEIAQGFEDRLNNKLNTNSEETQAA